MKMIDVHGVSKRYRIGAQRLPYRTLRESLRDMLTFGASRLETFNALSDINFDVEEGQSLAIIGKNGAGKTTLLKILSRITPPTTGRILLHGRVASLLEVGTGFHPELTGRENIYLNGSILGLTRREINAKLDAIIDFSGVEKFLSTPIKRYSTGMQLRLAFAVAAHLEPEILIIDEVLAVGDAEFQKKCLGKMEEVSQSGRTVLFVSHNMSAVTSLCSRALLLEAGRLTASGPVEDVVQKYLRSGVDVETGERVYEPGLGDDHVRLLRVSLRGQDNQVGQHFKVSQAFRVEIEAEVLGSACNPVPAIRINDVTGATLLVSAHPDQRPAVPGRNLFVAHIPGNLFNEGVFSLGLSLSTLEPERVHVVDYRVMSFEMIDDLHAPTRNAYRGKFPGYFRPLFEWSTEKLS
jgi:lipopolysaccharide transport system ATP-binding protein